MPPWSSGLVEVYHPFFVTEIEFNLPGSGCFSEIIGKDHENIHAVSSSMSSAFFLIHATWSANNGAIKRQ